MGWTITFLSPWWLLLLATLPFVVWQSAGSLAALGRFRRPLAIAFRCFVLLLLIAALADMQLVRRSERLCTLFVLDQSQSIPNSTADNRTDEALDIISDAMAARAEDMDQAGLVVFGKEARIELPPAEYPRTKRLKSVGSLLDRQHSDLSAGIKLALGSFPPDSSRRIVLLSDGNQNRGNVLAQAIAAKQDNVAIDVVPIEYKYDNEILVDKVVVPPDLNKGETANLKVVIRSARPASGLLRLNQVADGNSRTVLQKPVTLQEGLNVFFVKQSIDEPNFYTYEAQFEPGEDAGDRLARNNQASAFTWIRGEGHVLLIEPTPGDQQLLADKLRQDNLRVTARSPEDIRDNLAEMRQYDTIILANVPAERLGERVQETIAANTHELGAGLVMIGGPESFGAGGYTGSPIEKALPVDMEIKSTKIRGKGALVLIMHACEIPEGNFWQKKIAQLAIKMLGRQDECGLVYWGGQTSWLFTLQPVGDRQLMNNRIDRMTPGDMPQFDPAMQMALTSLLKSTAMVKHVIIISDGDPLPPSSAVLQGYKDGTITCTTVAVSAHGTMEKTLMKAIADATGGRYHEAANPKNLPQIYMKETRVVSRPLIYEQPTPWNVRLSLPTDPVAGLPVELPPILGFVLTSPKEQATVEVAVTSPLPSDAQVNPILAHWQYGLGKAVAFTSDTGQRWAVDWPKTELFAKFWSQVVRWSMRTAENDNLTVSTQEKDGQVTVVVNALDKASDFLNFLNLQGKLISPEMQIEELRFRQTEPGKYEASFPAEQSGSYLLRMGYRQPDGSVGMISTGLNVSYPPEYRDLQSNRDLLENVASLSGGRVIEWGRAKEADFFRRDQAPTLRLQDVWPLLLLTALCAFLGDVAVRRIAVDPRAIAAMAKRGWDRVRRRPVAPPVSATMERLRSKKAEVGEQFQKRRFEADITAPPAPSVLDETSRPIDKPTAPAAPPPSMAASPDEQPDSYTNRLLKAKQQVWKDRKEE